eukprot:scaffold742_cov395-Prasinococcus_capsulatus_cf.AAC.16
MVAARMAWLLLPLHAWGSLKRREPRRTSYSPTPGRCISRRMGRSGRTLPSWPRSMAVRREAWGEKLT